MNADKEFFWWIILKSFTFLIMTIMVILLTLKIQNENLDMLSAIFTIEAFAVLLFAIAYTIAELKMSFLKRILGI